MSDLSNRFTRLAEYKNFVLNFAKKNLDRQSFIKLHKIKDSKLCRILNQESKCEDEMFDYIVMHCGLEQYLYYDDIYKVSAK